MRWPEHLLTLDFETYWSDDYTLKKLSTEAYVRDPRFKAHGAAVKYDRLPSVWMNDSVLRYFLTQVPWGDVALLCQHAQFDGLILSHHYGYSPALFLDTLSMARMALPRQRHSLEALARYFELPPKGTALASSKNIRDLSPELEHDLAAYACHDADLTREIFTRLVGAVPPQELEVIDQTIRLFTEPRLTLDKPRARKLLASVIRGKRSAMRRLGVTKEELSSTDKFAALLEDRFGIEVEMKYGKRGPIPAVAKTDAFMKSLLDSEDPDVQALAATRLKVKSTLEETRLRRLLSMHERGALPVYLNHAGAHTLRWSGGDKMNWQNFPRGSELRKCIRAQKGYVLVVADKSQIEARMLNTLAEQWDVLAEFESGDPYSKIASTAYGYPVSKKTHPAERQVGKVLELASGYGMGPPKLHASLRAGAMGGAPVLIDMETADKWIRAYRTSHQKVVEYWGQAETAIQLLAGKTEQYPWGPMMLDKGRIWHPNGTYLDYTGLVREEGEWRMYDRYGSLVRNAYGPPVRVYGGLMTENVVQWLSRVNLAEDVVAMRRNGALKRWPLVMTTHDELVCMAPENEGQECLDYMIATMTKRPSWLPRIPLAAEGAFDVCYSK